MQFSDLWYTCCMAAMCSGVGFDENRLSIETAKPRSGRVQR